MSANETVKSVGKIKNCVAAESLTQVSLKLSVLEQIFAIR